MKCDYRACLGIISLSILLFQNDMRCTIIPVSLWFNSLIIVSLWEYLSLSFLYWTKWLMKLILKSNPTICSENGENLGPVAMVGFPLEKLESVYPDGSIFIISKKLPRVNVKIILSFNRIQNINCLLNISICPG